MGLKEIAERVVDAFKPTSPEAAEARGLIEQYLTETKDNRFFYGSKPTDYPSGRAILETDPQRQAQVLREIVSQTGNNYGSALYALKAQLLSRKLPLSLGDIEALVDRAAAARNSWVGSWGAAVKKTRLYLDGGGYLTSSLETSLKALHTQATHYSSADNRKIAIQIEELLGTSSVGKFDPGDPWADRALSDLATLPLEAQSTWSGLLAHAATAEGSKPSAKWLAEAARHRQTVGEEDLFQHLAAWFALVAPPPAFTRVAPKYDGADSRDNGPIYREYVRAYAEYSEALRQYLNGISEKNVSLLKGLAWYASTSGAADVARGVAHMTQAAFTSVVGYGNGATRAGNAGIWALGQMPGGVGVGPLARLRTRLRDRGALKLIAAAIESAAKAAGMSVDELEDLAVPTGGLGADGMRRGSFGAEGSAALTLDAASGRVRLEWFGAEGKPRKAVPAGVKREFAAEVKALKAAEEEIKQALSAQAARFDGFLIEERAWPLAVWRERYLSHPVLGNLARRLVWVVGNVPCLVMGDDLQDVSGKAVEGRGDDTPVSLWHPIGAAPEVVLRWRDVLEARGIVQPFKQAHREVYLLTDAERATRTYSNRFAAHVLKQHQFNSLCVLRGWKNMLRLMVDDEYPPATRLLPRHGLRAEFWVEGIGDNYGVDTNDAGTYLRVATDQVRFYREDAPVNYAHAGGGGYTPYRPETPADPLPLDQVPPLVLSEVMRDVDLFVGVASVGNDPAWADGGPEGRYRDYWRDYAFGDLGETAKTRAAVLARLLPRLKIAQHCRLDGKFLVVQGDLRTYKIHLGSGNILMEPNDQYLCIVPGRGGEETGDLFLPFEGDRMLAIILSKAFLLADDTKIKDATIVSQIKR